MSIGSFRWRLLLSTHSRNRFWKFCITRCSMMEKIAATSSLMFSFNLSDVLGRFSYALLLRYPHRKKLQAFRSGYLSGHSVSPFRELMRAGNISLRTRIEFLAVWAVAPCCWNQIVWISTRSLCKSGSRNVRIISMQWTEFTITDLPACLVK
jgi:hypothetical protein